MKKVYAFFGGSAYDNVSANIAANAIKYGADELWCYDDRFLMTTDIWKKPEVQYLWTCKGVGNPHSGRGLGWFFWKSWVIQDALSRLDDGDIVLYTDADTYPIHHFGMLYEECQRIGGMMFFRAEGCWHSRWCKRDCFIVMGMDEPQWRNRQHAVARFMLFQKGAPGVNEFLAEWLHYCLIKEATTFDPSVLAPEHPEFLELVGGNTGEHRTEQAIATNLIHYRGLKLYREACQAGATQPEDQDLYPQLFIQDGTVGENKLTGSKYFFVPGVVR